jgi:hypothetical protein
MASELKCEGVELKGEADYGKKPSSQRIPGILFREHNSMVATFP